MEDEKIIPAKVNQDASAIPPCKHEKSIEIQQTIDFLKEGERKLNLDDNYRDVILVVGITGTGKSTLTQFVAGDLNNLISVGETNFIIKSRHEGVIGNSTTVSQTIFPGLVIDEDKIAFYDCPGYDDTRSMSIEVASTYYVKKVIEHSHSVKIILVVDYNSVHVAGSRTGFPKLVRHLRNFVKNLTRYNDSIALVANKVPNEYVFVNNELTQISDEKVIGNIAEFFKKYREQLETEESSELNAYALELIEILLREDANGKTYKKIGIFRKPNTAGPLQKIDMLKEGCAKIRDLVLKRTTYGKKVDDDFGYTISEASRLKLIDLTQAFNQEIAASVRRISNEIEENFRDEERKLGNLVAMTSRFQSGYEFLSDISGNTKNMNGFLLRSQLLDATNSLNITISREYLDEILNMERNIQFVKGFTTDQLPLNPAEWVGGLKGCVDYLEGMRIWFQFLSEIYNQYSQYDFRCELSKYNVFDVNDWGTDSKVQGIHINSDNFWAFVQKQKNAALIRNQEPTEIQLEVLNNLLDITIKQVPVISCEEDNTKVVVKGDYVRTSDINIKQYGNKLQQLHIFALHTVFIDSDIDAVGSKLNLSIVAPNWYISGGRTFDLSGSNNEFNYESAADSSTTSKTADSGAPGKSGGNAGNFVGFGLNFVNGDKLQILAIGGKGSPGQDGGNGWVANDPDVSTIEGESPNDVARSERKKYRNVKDLQEWDWYLSFRCFGIKFVEKHVAHGYSGSSGGDGGRGGKGGRPGFLKLIELGPKSSVSLIMGSGEDGEPGKGGKIGRNPQKVALNYSYYRTLLFFKVVEGWTEHEREDDHTCPPLRESSDGANVEGIEEPNEPSDYESAVPLNEFKMFVRENQKNNLKRDDLANFVELMHNSDSVLANYTMEGFVKELLTIEKKFYAHHNEIDLASHYDGYSKRLERYVSQLNPSNVPQEQLKVVNFLLAAAWGKYLATNSTKSSMAIEVDGYLRSTIENILKFDAPARTKIMDDKRKEYRADIDLKINEVTAFIQSDIIPAITSISHSIDDRLNALIDEIVKKRKQTANEVEAYEKQQKMLQNEMVIRRLLDVLTATGSFSTCLGLHGIASVQIASGISQTAIGFYGDCVAQTGNCAPSAPGRGAQEMMAMGSFYFVTSQVSKAISRSRQCLLNYGGSKGGVQKAGVPKRVRTALDEHNKSMEKRREAEIDGFRNVIRRIDEEAGKYLGPLRYSISNIEVLHKHVDQKKNNREKNEITMDDLTSLLSESLKLTSNRICQNGKLNKEEKAALEIVQKWEKMVDIFRHSTNMYEKVTEDEVKLEELWRTFQKPGKILDEMRKFEEKLYNQLWLMISELRKQIKDIKDGQTRESQAALALKRFPVQSTIQDIKFMLQKFRNGVIVQEDLAQVLQNLDEVFETYINIYHRIENYHDQEKLALYIVTIDSADVARIEMFDLEFLSALSQLDLMISSNVVLSSYNTAIETFKQAVFPFAACYQDQYRLPNHLELMSSTKYLAQAAAANLEGLRTMLNKYKRADINGQDNYIVNTTFDSRLPPSQSFFEWKSENCRQSIAKLFAGKEVSLFADVKNGPQFNAVKFNVVELLFRTRGERRQAKLDSILNKVMIHLTHNGNSYYRCGASYYVINGRSQELIYSFEKKDDGTPVQRNCAYDSIQSGTMMLSPYAMWTIRLENISEDSKLSAFAEHTDLALIGHGQYVSSDAPVCGTTLDEYYDAY